MAATSPCANFALLLFLLVHFLAASTIAQDDLVINTKHGKVQGKLLSVLGGEVRAFLGIPYGKPPLDKLRFKPPEPAKGWDGVRDCTNYPNSCFQVPDTAFKGFKGSEMWNPNTLLSEDCLYLNVWTPRFNKTQTLAPVLVWIYGGGFYSGTSSLDIYDGRFLSRSEGVVVVSMNYRVGPLGFLSLPDNKNIRGNAGLLDQRLALQWVADNIAAFWGDPSKVTLFGESAGSASVGYQLLSPGSQGLFQRAVMQSGSPNAPWASVSQEVAWQRSMRLGSLVGCSTSDTVRLEACLQKADPGTLTSKSFDVFTKARRNTLPFAPVMDGDFLPDKPEVLLNSGKLPNKEVMFGLTKDEGTYFLMYGMPGFSLKDNSLISRKDFLDGVTLTMADSSDTAKETAIFYYTDWTSVDSGMLNRNSLGKLVGDQMFCSLVEFAYRYSQRGGKSFFYSFEHRSSVNPWPEWMGIMHGYEIEFVFGMPLNASLGYTKAEVNMTKKFMKHWANFARTGNPSIDGVLWPTFSPEQQQYMTLNSHQPEQRSMMKVDECHLWNKLIPNIQKVSDELLSCVRASGITVCCNYMFLLFMLALSLTCF